MPSGVPLALRGALRTSATQRVSTFPYIDLNGTRFPVEDRTLALVTEALGCVYAGAGGLEAAALLDALTDRGLRIVTGASVTGSWVLSCVRCHAEWDHGEPSTCTCDPHGEASHG